MFCETYICISHTYISVNDIASGGLRAYSGAKECLEMHRICVLLLSACAEKTNKKFTPVAFVRS